MSKRTGGGIFLDMPYGTGNISAYAKDYFKICVGLDISIEMLKIAKARRYMVIRSDALESLFPHEQFDGVALFSVVHHILKTSDLVREIYRILKPGGILYTDWGPNFDYHTSMAARLYRKLDTLYCKLRNKSKDLDNSMKSDHIEDIPEFVGKIREVAKCYWEKGLNHDSIRKDLLSIGFSKVHVFTHNNFGSLYRISRDSIKGMLISRFISLFTLRFSPNYLFYISILAQK